MFVWPMSNPADRRRSFTAILSSSDTPATGAGNIADAPPDSASTMRSSGPAPSASARIPAAPRAPAASGVGWPQIWTRAPATSAATWVATMASSHPVGISARAMGAAALPAAIRMRRPATAGSGRAASATRTAAPGSAAATAAAKAALAARARASSVIVPGRAGLRRRWTTWRSGNRSCLRPDRPRSPPSTLPPFRDGLDPSSVRSLCCAGDEPAILAVGRIVGAVSPLLEPEP